MTELSLHILDIVENSIAAAARLISVIISVVGRMLSIEIVDDGRGMDEALLERVVSPFATTRTTRKVGLGIPMFKQCAEMCGGEFEISSAPGAGTRVRATFELAHVDRPPMGDLSETVAALVVAIPEGCDIELKVSGRAGEFEFATAEIRRIMDGVPITTPEVLSWIKDYVKEGIESVDAGF